MNIRAWLRLIFISSGGCLLLCSPSVRHSLCKFDCWNIFFFHVTRATVYSSQNQKNCLWALLLWIRAESDFIAGLQPRPSRSKPQIRHLPQSRGQHSLWTLHSVSEPALQVVRNRTTTRRRKSSTETSPMWGVWQIGCFIFFPVGHTKQTEYLLSFV